MKKVLIGIVLLIPILVIACVQIAGSIISQSAYVAVEKISLNATEHVFENVGDSFKLNAGVYPKIARNKEVKYYVMQTPEGKDDIVYMDDRFDPEKYNAVVISDDGKVTVNTYCSFTVVCESVSAGKRAFCHFRVGSGKVHTVSVVSPKETLRKGERVALIAKTDPQDADIDGHVEWTSNNEAVATVDQNGIVRAVSDGGVTITAKVRSGGTVVEGKCVINVGGGAFRDDVIYVSSNEVSLSDFAYVTDVTVVSGGRISGGKLIIDDKVAYVEANGEQAAVKVIDPKILEFLNADLMPTKLFIGKGQLALTPVYVATGEPAKCAVVSSDEEIAYYKDGFIVPVSVGKVTFTVEKDGYTTSFSLEVKRAVSYFFLSDSELSDKQGIKQTTVYGNKSFTDKSAGSYSAESATEFTRRFTISSPTDLSPSDFRWESDRPDIARFDDKDAGLLHYAENISGVQKVTITVTAKYPVYENVKIQRKYSFYLAEAVNTYGQKDFEYVANVSREAISMHGDAIVEEGQENGRWTNYYVGKNIYGNGHMIANYAYTYDDRNNDFVKIIANDVTVSNVTVRLRTPVEVFHDKNTFGKAISFSENEFGTWGHATGQRLEYSIVEFARHGITVYGTDVEIEGCIVRNVAKYGIYAMSRCWSNDYVQCNNTTVKNCVFSNINCPAIGIESGSTDYNGEVVKKPDGTPFQTKQIVKIEGFVDFYNWKSLDDLNLLGDITDNPIINKAAEDYIKGQFSGEKYVDFRYVGDDGKEYVNLGIFKVGGLNVANADILTSGDTEEDESSLLDKYELGHIAEDLRGIVKPVYLYGYMSETAPITPDMVFEDTLEAYKELREGRKES